jgi:hypothetical protein
MTDKKPILKPIPSSARTTDVLERKSIFRNWFTYIYISLVLADLILEQIAHTILIPTKVLLSLLVILDLGRNVRVSLAKKNPSLHGILLIIAFIASVGGDAFAIYSKDVLKLGLSMGLYIISRIVLAIIYYYIVLDDDVNSGAAVVLQSIVFPGVFGGLVLLVMKADLGNDFGMTLVFMLASMAACSGALLTRYHVKSIAYANIATGLVLLMVYDGVFLVARFKEWQKRNYYMVMMFVNFLAWYFISRGGVWIVKRDINKKKYLEDEFEKKDLKNE